jgi:histidinol-phosphatase (PHP family)
VLASYHNHTSWSGGKATVAVVVEIAQQLGLDEVGISDHLTMPPSGDSVSWSMPPQRLDDYAADVLAAAQRARAEGGPVVRLGVELDWFDGHRAVLARVLEQVPLDYVIGSVHFCRGIAIDGSAAVWRRWTPDERDDVFREYWQQIRHLAESGLVDIMAHLDLPKKFGFAPQQAMEDIASPALDAIAEAGLVVELNTAGWHKPCREAYPGPSILRACRQRDIPVTLSADAHDPADLLRDFPAAAQLLADAGYDEVARFEKRCVRFEALSSATPLSPAV